MTDVPTWAPEDDNMLYQVLKAIGVPKENKPVKFELQDDLEWTDEKSWNDVATELNSLAGKSAPNRSGAVCCFRFYGPLEGKKPDE